MNTTTPSDNAANTPGFTGKISRYRVDSYHINVGTGDAAVHVLVAELDSGVDRAEKLVWIDSGYDNRFFNVKASFANISNAYENLKGQSSLRFDAIIITHWDWDHYGAFSILIDTKGLDLYLRDKPPNTRLFCSSTLNPPKKNASPDKDPDKVPTQIKALFGKLNSTTPVVKEQIRLTDLPVDVILGSGMIGTDVFSLDTIGVPDRRKSANLDELVKSFPAHASPQPAGGTTPSDANKPIAAVLEIPLLLIAAVDEHVIGTTSAQVSAYRETDTTWDDESTHTNRSSIGCFIIWPYSKKVSHYFAGDLYYKQENALALWFSNSKWGRVTSIKASHHGSASSTPARMLSSFQPKNIVVSAGNKHSHPDWETLMSISGYVTEMNKTTDALQRGPLVMTRYPTWLKRATGASRKGTIGQNATTIIGPAYFGQTVGGKRGKQIAKFLAVMRTGIFGPIAMWKELEDAVALLDKSQWRTKDKEQKAENNNAIIREMHKVMVPRQESMFGNFVNPRAAPDRQVKDLRYIRVKSYPKDSDDLGDLDGSVFERVKEDPEIKIVPPVSKTVAEPMDEVETETLPPPSPPPPSPPLPSPPPPSRKRKQDDVLRDVGSNAEIESLEEDAKRRKPNDDSGDEHLMIQNDTSTPMNFMMFAATSELKSTDAVERDNSPMLFATADGTPASTASTTTPAFKYSLLVSDATDQVKALSTQARRLKDVDPLDNFIDCLQARAIRLTSSPSPDGVLLDENDTTFKWFKWTLDAVEVRVKGTADDVSAVSIRTKKGMVFETAYAGMSLGSHNSSNVWESPGLLKGTGCTTMVFGLTPPGGDVWKSSDIIDFLAGISGSRNRTTAGFHLHDIWSSLDTTQWSLGLDNKIDPPMTLQGMRNAVWFSPFLEYQTRLRLEFYWIKAGDVGNGPLELLKKFWPKSVNVEVASVKLICASTARLGLQTSKDTKIRSNVNLSLVAALSVSISGGERIALEGIVELNSSGSVTLTVQSADKTNKFGSFVQALVKDMFDGQDASFGSKGSPIPNEIQEAIMFRRLRLTLSKRGLQEATVVMELKTSLGAAKKQSVAVRLDAGYHKGAPGGGLFLEGALWFPIKEDASMPLSHFGDYESIYNLQPWTTDAVPYLSLPALLPDSANIINELLKKVSVPQLVTEASFSLTPASLRIDGTIESCTGYKPHKDLPRLDFSEVSIGAEIVWEGRRISFDLGFRIDLQAPDNGFTPRATPVNQLIGRFSYDSGATGGVGKSWEVSAHIGELQLGLLYEYFEPGSRDMLYDILREIKIRDMTISYGTRGDLSTFEARGDFLIAGTESIGISFIRYSDGNWSISASLDTEITSKITLATIAASIFGPSHDIVTGLPDFLADIQVLGPGIQGPSLTLQCTKDGEDGVMFMLEARLSKLSVTFLQLHRKDRLPLADGKGGLGPIRYFKLSCKDLKIPGTDQNATEKPPLMDKFQPPFDEIGFLWVSTELTGPEATAVGAILAKGDAAAGTPPQAPGQDSEKMAAGFHFVLLSQGATVIDHPLSKARSIPRKIDGEPPESTGEQPGNGEKGQANESPAVVDNRSAKAPVKKSSGALTINHIQIHYKESTLSIQMDAVFSIGPLMFALFGFQIGMDFRGGASLASLDIKNVTVSIDGMAASFKKPPLTLEGGLIHKKSADEDIFAGGITIGFVPWLFQAAGFYGKKKNPSTGQFFTSALVYAILRGPLITLEFATISGITGGFGYNVGINMPTVGEVYRFPFTKSQSSGDDDIVHTLNALIGTATPPDRQWFFHQEGAMWLACGLTVSAFEMLDVTAVLVAQWSPQLQFHVLGLASADIPNAKSSFKFAHVELGFLASIDVTIGLFSVEAQLTPNSYILDPSCHLSGGFALYYWSKTTNVASAGDFVLTLGGYHNAYQKPEHYPRPPRLAISWALGDSLSITGEAYFAVTPKVCMAGMHVKAVLTLGKLRAWFDAYADFLINYAPFKFTAEAHVSVGVSYSMDVWFVHTQISVEIGATLKLYGPPIAGIVHVDFYVFGFDIEFGDRSNQIGDGKLSLEKFYALVLEMDSKVAQRTAKSDSPHVYACLGGLLSKGSSPKVEENEAWDVRGGPFSYAINSHFAIEKAWVNDVEVPGPADRNKDQIFAKPMRLQNAMQADLKVTVNDSHGKPTGNRKNAQGELVSGWRLEPIMKTVPSGLWGRYDPSHDPLSSGNNVGELLSGDNAPVKLVMGVRLKAPEPYVAHEKLVPFDIEAAMMQTLKFDPAKTPHIAPSKANFRKQSKLWTPAKPIPLVVKGLRPAEHSSEEDTDESSDEDVEVPPTLATASATNQWEAVREAWRNSDPRSNVEAWASLLPWGAKKDAAGKSVLPLQAEKPKYMIQKIPDLFLEAPRMCLESS